MIKISQHNKKGNATYKGNCNVLQRQSQHNKKENAK